MAGFFSPSLNFATTGGAFLSGFAKQANENIEQQRNQDRQDDIIWANRFERGLAEYDKEKKDSDFKAKAYNTILGAVNGNKKLADTAFLGVLNSPKDFGNYLNWAIANKDKPDFQQGPDYQSNMLDTMQSGINSKYSNLQTMRNNVRPQAQKFMQMPEAPNSVPQTITQQQPSFTNGPTSQNNAPAAQPQPQSAQSVGASGQPDPLINENTNPQLNNEINAAPNTGELSLDQQPPPVSSAGMPPKVSGQALPLPQPAQAATPYPAAQPQPNQSYIPFGSKPNNNVVLNPLDPNTWQHFANRPALEQAMIDNGVPANIAKTRAAGAITGEELTARQQLQHPNMGRTPEQIADLDLKKKDVDRYLHDPKTGFQSRVATLGDLQRQNQDVSSIVQVLNRGFAASAVQPMYDELNRFTSGLLGVDLKTLGIDANNYRDVNIMKKDISNGIISRLSTLHFGRITNFEAGLVQKGFTSNANDPDTNIKIGLMLQNSVRSAMDQLQQEDKAIYDARNSNKSEFEVARAGQSAAYQAREQYLRSNEDAPWAKIPLTANAIPQLAKLTPGTWFEDPSSGEAGRMYRIVGVDNGSLLIQDAKGVQKRAPIGQQ